MASVLHGSPHGAASSSRVPSVEREQPGPCRPLRPEREDGAQRRKRTTTGDALMGPKRPKSTVLTPAEEAIVVAFRQKTLLRLDDVLGCLRNAIPHYAGLAHCAHGLSRCRSRRQRKRFKAYEIGYVHIELRVAPRRRQARYVSRHRPSFQKRGQSSSAFRQEAMHGSFLIRAIALRSVDGSNEPLPLPPASTVLEFARPEQCSRTGCANEGRQVQAAPRSFGPRCTPRSCAILN